MLDASKDADVNRRLLLKNLLQILFVIVTFFLVVFVVLDFIVLTYNELLMNELDLFKQD